MGLNFTNLSRKLARRSEGGYRHFRRGGGARGRPQGAQGVLWCQSGEGHVLCDNYKVSPRALRSTRGIETKEGP